MSKTITTLVTGLLIALTPLAYSNSSFDDSTTTRNSNDSGPNQNQLPMRTITPIAGPRVAHGIDVFLSANYIFWKTSMGLPQIFSTTAQTVPTPQIGITDNAALGQLDWSSGFKVGLGINLPHDGWDLQAEYTWLRPSGTVTTFEQPADFLGVSVVSGLMVYATNGREDQKLDFNNLDLTLGRNFYLSQYLTMKPSVGLKGTWQNDEIKRTYSGENTSFTPSLLYPVARNVRTVDSLFLANSSESWGIGPRLALYFDFFMTKSFSLYGKAAWTGMARALYERDEELRFENPAPIFGIQGTNLEFSGKTPKTYYSGHHVTELELGFKYDWYFSEDQYHISIEAGWETQTWFNWVHAERTINDLNFMGLNIKARFDF